MEATERRGRFLAIAAILFILFWSQCKGVDGHRNTTKMYYVCPPHFIRLGHSCYYFSENKATWQNALFSCKMSSSERHAGVTDHLMSSGGGGSWKLFVEHAITRVGNDYLLPPGTPMS
ncbi:hypothetical protein EVAR_89555_1 [Eumeta japonica]|uniref:C-type lectin domain-containing protein n=1 Tax=Eumeta variegata TaxID=151549 RepID=A0A4C1YSR1_EUMVA|nr:hypothetical protein EVAR_89555_1 [Eumeta japonica]